MEINESKQIQIKNIDIKKKKKKRKFKNIMKELTKSDPSKLDNSLQIIMNTGGGNFSKIDKI